MSAGSGIEWTEHTWNPVSGCTRASAGCDNCYAVKQTYRLEKMGQVEKYGGLTVLNPKGERQFNGVVRCHEDALDIPLKWKKPRRIFVNSMSDLFHKGVPFEFVDKVFAVMALCPQHMFQVLTKRPERMAEYLRDRRCMMGFKTDECVTHEMIQIVANLHPVQLYKRFSYPMPSDVVWPLPNVWLGTSTENQAAADERIPHLLRCPAAVRFLSVEPMLGPVDLVEGGHGFLFCNENADGTRTGIHWVIVGGESGPGARPFNVEWARTIITQCKAAGVACFVKQLGEHAMEDGVPHAEIDDPAKFAASWRSKIKKFEGGGSLKPDSMWLIYTFHNRKGSDPAEWPADLRVRKFPTPAGVESPV